MNTLMMQMRHTAHELRVTLDHVLQGGEASVEPQNSQSETVSFLNESEAEMRAIHNMAEVRTKAASESCFISPALFFPCRVRKPTQHNQRSMESFSASWWCQNTLIATGFMDMLQSDIFFIIRLIIKKQFYEFRNSYKVAISCQYSFANTPFLFLFRMNTAFCICLRLYECPKTSTNASPRWQTTKSTRQPCWWYSSTGKHWPHTLCRAGGPPLAATTVQNHNSHPRF